jgi:hypothetical protein
LRVELHTVFLQQRQVFILKGLLGVMRFLILDVRAEGVLSVLEKKNGRWEQGKLGGQACYWIS